MHAVANRVARAGDLRYAPTHALAAVLRIRDFRRLWVGLGLSSLGDWLGLLALTAMANASRRRRTPARTTPSPRCCSCGCCRRWCSGRSPATSPTGSTGAWTLVWGDFLRGALFVSIPLVGDAVVGLRGHGARRGWSAWSGGRPRTRPSRTWSPPHRLEAANQISLATTYGSALPAAAIFAGLTLRRPGVAQLIDWSRSAPVDARAVRQRADVRRLRSRDRHVCTPIPRGPAARRPTGGVLTVIVDGWAYVARTPVVRGLVIGIVGAFAAGGVGDRPGPDVRRRPRRRRPGLRPAVRRGVRRPRRSACGEGPRLLPGLPRRRLFGHRADR